VVARRAKHLHAGCAILPFGAFGVTLDGVKINSDLSN
jgi:hypothetical protein